MNYFRMKGKIENLNFPLFPGHYVALTQSEQSLLNSEEQIMNIMIKEMTEGCEESMDVKAGFIGEVGSAWPMDGK